MTVQVVGDGSQFELCAMFDNPEHLFWTVSFYNMTFCDVGELMPTSGPPPYPHDADGDVCDSFVPYLGAVGNDCLQMGNSHYATDYTTLLDMQHYTGWVYDWPDPTNTIQRACRRFTINNLAACRARDYILGKNEANDQPSVDVTPDGMHAEADVFINVYTHTDCEYAGTDRETAGKCSLMKHSVSYDLTVNYHHDGELFVYVRTGAVNIELSWIKIRWAPGDYVLVYLMTSTSQLDQVTPGVYTTKLTNYEVVSFHETGPAVQVIEYTDCLPSSPPDRCNQLFILRSDNPQPLGLQGFKPVRADIVVDTTPTFLATAILHVNLDIWHDEDIQADTGPDVVALVARDRQFEQLYNPYAVHGHGLVIDCSMLYFLIRSENIPEGYDLRIKQISLCVGTTGPLDDYDPLDPEHTACNTPGVGVETRIVWSRSNPELNDPIFKAVYLSEYLLSNHEDGVGMTVKVLSEYGNEYIIIDWEMVVQEATNAPIVLQPKPQRLMAGRAMIPQQQRKLQQQQQQAHQSKITFGEDKKLLHGKPHHNDEEEDDVNFGDCHGEEHCFINIWPQCPDNQEYHHQRRGCHDRQGGDNQHNHHEEVNQWFAAHLWQLLIGTIVFIIFLIVVCGCICATRSKIGHMIGIARAHHNSRHHHTHSGVVAVSGVGQSSPTAIAINSNKKQKKTKKAKKSKSKPVSIPIAPEPVTTPTPSHSEGTLTVRRSALNIQDESSSSSSSEDSDGRPTRTLRSMGFIGELYSDPPLIPANKK